MPKKPFLSRFNRRVLLIRSAISMGALLIGMDFANEWIFLDTDIAFDRHMALHIFLWTVGAVIGCVLVFLFGDRFNRRIPIFLATFIYTIGSLLVLWENRKVKIWAPELISLFFIGFGVGILSTCVPLYVIEMSSPKTRGSGTAIYQIFYSLGYFIASAFEGIIAGKVSGIINRSRALNISLQAIPAVLYIILLYFYIPESPHTLALLEGNPKVIGEVIAGLKSSQSSGRRHNVSKEEINEEINELRHCANAEIKAKTKNRFHELFRPTIIARMISVLIIHILLNFCGVIYVMFAANDVFVTGFTFNQRSQASFISIWGTLHLISSISTYIFIDMVGRTKIIMYSSICMSIWLIVIAIMKFLSQTNSFQASNVPIFIFLCFHVLFYGPAMISARAHQSEIFPLRLKCFCQGIVMAIDWFVDFIVVFTIRWAFITDDHSISIFFALCALILTAYSFLGIQETKNIPLYSMEDVYKLK